MMKLLACISVIGFRLMVCVHSEFIEPSPSLALRSFSSTQTRMPCRFMVEADEQVVQVTWSRQKPGGEREQIIVGHFTEGPIVSPDFLSLVQFESSDPTVDSTLLILNTKKADQATYTCHISIFPSGSFQRQISLTVWRVLRLIGCAAVPPDAVIADSGSWRVGHSGSELRCVVKGNPLPQNVTWSRKDDRLPAGVLVKEDRLMFVRPLNVTDEGVYVCQTANSAGIAKAEFKVEIGSRCLIYWKDDRLPAGVLVKEDRLMFVRPLNVTDEGVYVCQTANSAGIAKAEFKVEIGKRWPESARALGSPSETLLIIIGASVAGVLVIVIVIAIILINCHLRRKNRKLKRALSTRTEEMISLSRQVSMRRLDSFNGDLRTALEEIALIQMDSVTKGSVLSVEDRSTLSDVKGRHGDREYDSLGRPAIYTAYRPARSSRNIREIEEERNERRRRVESYVKSSSMSLVLLLCRLP
ncbi:nectin-4-like [Sinocyclocheilus grahami]|uniref:nectin-4-like n=1 Tax=Sinocyclocheilus grahami TaxID=75366 RepID=UPI0007AD2201|nr:PREDICTED: nectin-4-like [Sinocyclocheilus grahami]